MAKPPVAPYPPDVDDDAPGEIEFGDLVNAVVREATFSSARLERVELRGCDLAGLRGGEALRGARM
ncbi:MAG: hypothetical protein EXQ81_07175 [Thermoleophilia bacterium]|nr:hypothetical protein [Thermoleophilia bacterium]